MIVTNGQVPKGCVLGIRVGETLKQKRLDSKATCSFPAQDGKVRLSRKGFERDEGSSSLICCCWFAPLGTRKASPCKQAVFMSELVMFSYFDVIRDEECAYRHLPACAGLSIVKWKDGCIIVFPSSACRQAVCPCMTCHCAPDPLGCRLHNRYCIREWQVALGTLQAQVCKFWHYENMRLRLAQVLQDCFWLLNVPFSFFQLFLILPHPACPIKHGYMLDRLQQILASQLIYIHLLSCKIQISFVMFESWVAFAFLRSVLDRSTSTQASGHRTRFPLVVGHPDQNFSAS